jgi:hypothetical protein
MRSPGRRWRSRSRRSAVRRRPVATPGCRLLAPPLAPSSCGRASVLLGHGSDPADPIKDAVTPTALPSFLSMSRFQTFNLALRGLGI